MSTETDALLPGQYQFNGIKFGRHTPYPVSDVQIQSYNVNAQDFQVIQSDENQFGQDSFQPGQVIFEIGAEDFKLIPNMLPLANNPGDFDRSYYETRAQEFEKAWRGDNVRRTWGQILPMRVCQDDGKVMLWYGRPRKFQKSKKSAKSCYYTMHAEFMRADTLAYNEDEYWVEVPQMAAPQFIIRDGGDCDAWLRIIGEGPLDHPVITIGDQQIALDIDLDEGEMFEVSSYPWIRRAIDSSGRNLAAKLTGNTQYLDRLVIPANAPCPVRWTASNVNTFVPVLEDQHWQESIDGVNFWGLGPTFTNVSQAPCLLRFDLFNPKGPTKFIGGSWIGTVSACIYNKAQFGTSNQYAEARVVEPWPGSSGIAIMSNANMTNFACVVGQSIPGNNAIKISTGTSPAALTHRVTVPLNRGWSEEDILGIGYDPATKTYQAYLNRQPFAGCSWADPTGIVNTANRRQGFVFDLDATLISIGMGFTDIIAYDRATVPAPIGRIAIGWRDAYSGVR